MTAPATPTTAVTTRLPAPPVGTARELLTQPAVIERFNRALNDPNKAAQFVASLSTLVYGSPQLKRADPNSIIAAAIKAAALDLAIDPGLGHAYIVPYGDKAQFQIGWKGLVQLALRTGEYEALNVAHVYAGQLTEINPITGAIKFGVPTSEKVVGVVAYLKLRNGFEKFVYWSLDKIHAHAKRYSKSYARSDSAWQTNAGAMELKTAMRDLLSKWGLLSIQMRTALADEAPDVDNQAGVFENDEIETQAHAPLEADVAQAEPKPDNAQLDAAVVASDDKAKNKQAKLGATLYPEKD